MRVRRQGLVEAMRCQSHCMSGADSCKAERRALWDATAFDSRALEDRWLHTRPGARVVLSNRDALYGFPRRPEHHRRAAFGQQYAIALDAERVLLAVAGFDEHFGDAFEITS